MAQGYLQQDQFDEKNSTSKISCYSPFKMLPSHRKASCQGHQCGLRCLLSKYTCTGPDGQFYFAFSVHTHTYKPQQIMYIGLCKKCCKINSADCSRHRIMQQADWLRISNTLRQLKFTQNFLSRFQLCNQENHMYVGMKSLTMRDKKKQIVKFFPSKC